MLILCSSGSNAQGQLGNGSLDDAHTFQKCSFAANAPQLSRIVDIAGGANHTTLLLEVREGSETHREIWGCGDGRKGQLGERYQQGGLTSTFRKLELGLEDAGLIGYTFKFIAATWETSYIVLECEGRGDVVISMGSDDYGDLGVGDLRPPKEKGKAAARDFHIVRFDHLSTPSGSRMRTEKVKVDAISSGQRHVIVQLHLQALDSQSSPGQIFIGWGTSRHGQLGPSISAKPPSFLTLPQLVTLPAAQNIKSCAAGIHHTVFLNESGHLSALGSDRKRQIQLVEQQPFAPNHVQAVGCTWNGTYAVIQEDEGSLKVYSCGSNSHSQLGWTPATGSDEIVGVVAFPRDFGPKPTDIQLACGSEHVLLLLTEPNSSSSKPEVWGWGWNEHGNLGTGDTDDVPTPIKILPPNAGDTSTNGLKVEGVWAGCGTSWIAYSDTA